MLPSTAVSAAGRTTTHTRSCNATTGSHQHSASAASCSNKPSAQLAGLLRVAPSTVRSWADGHQPRTGVRLDRHREGVAVWWRVTAASD